jgi:putative SOS response-associated peptidase YedK
MCGRYTISTTRHGLAEAFPAVAALAGDLGFERFNVAPTDEVIALRAGRDGHEATRLRWGLVPHWARDRTIASRLLNARAETVAAKPAFRALVQTAASRCLVLADGYYEWLKPESPRAPRQPMHFALADRRPFAFAGLWTTWRDPGGMRLQTCTILTTTANAIAAPVHDRMPVILADAARQAAWLDPVLGAAEIWPLLAPLPDDLLRVAPASALVNSVRNEGPQLLEPAAGEPRAALTLF